MTSALKFLIFCAIFVISSTFELGTERTFSFINDVSQHDLKQPVHSIGYRISGAVKVATIWSNVDNNEILLRFELESPQLYLQKLKVEPADYDEKVSVLKSHHKTTFYGLLNQGKIEKAFLPKTKDTSIDNFLRAILSLFQYQLEDTEKEDEDDISGTCAVRYSAKSSTNFMKYKTDCTSDREFHERLEKPLDVSNRLTRVNVIKTSADGELESVHSTDHHRITVNGYQDTGFRVSSLFYLKSDGKVSEIQVAKGLTLTEAIKKLGTVEETTLLPVYDETAKSDEKNLIKLIKDSKENLQDQHVGKALSAKTILALLPTARSSKFEEFSRILSARTTKEIRGQLIDLLAAVQTEASHEAFRSTMNFTNDEDYNDIERYLQALAIGIHPEETILRDLMMLAETSEITEQKLKDSIILCMSAMANRFANSPEQDFESHVVVEVKNFLLKQFNKCEENECKIMYLRGLQNLGSPDTVERLLKIATGFNYQISVAAMKSLSKFSASSFQPETKEILQDIFYQKLKKFDSSARTLALDTLFKLKLETGDVFEMVSFLGSWDRAFEVKQYLIQRMRMAADKCSRFAEMLSMALAKNPQVNNWNIFGASKGLSTTLSRSFSRRPSFDGTILSLQEMKGGVLKRGKVDLKIHSGDQESNVFSMGLFAGGLSSFMSSSEEDVDPDEDTTTTAGMELAIQGSQMRPLVFFNGQGELMSHVWSGTASEPTTAYKGVSLLQDNKQKLSLNNGAFLDLTTLGAMSVDLNGKIEISLWYKTASVEIEQNTGTALSMTAKLASPIAELSTELLVSEEPQINVATKVEFSSQPALCMQLSQPNKNLTHIINHSIYVPGEKKSKAFQQMIRLNYHIPGCTHLLNKKTNEMCNRILN